MVLKLKEIFLLNERQNFSIFFINKKFEMNECSDKKMPPFVAGADEQMAGRVSGGRRDDEMEEELAS